MRYPRLSGRLVPLLAAAAVVALGFVPLANVLSGGPYIPWWTAAVREWLVTGSAILLLAILLARLLGERLDRWGSRLTGLALAARPGVFVAVVGCCAFALTAVFAVYCFGREPFSQDEMAQRFHAHLLLAGRLFARGEAHPEFFSATGVLDSGGRFTSQYPIGGPAVLALGMALHAVWLVNPLLTALTARNVYRFAADTCGERVGRASAVLFTLSPFVLIMGASEMNHVAALALATLALAALPAWAAATDRRAMWRAAALIGLGVGGLAAVRPLDAAALAAVIGIFQLTVLARDRARWASLIPQVIAAAVPLACLLYTNREVTGHPLLFAYNVLYGPNERLGFHLDPFGRPHTPLHGVLLMSANLMRLNRNLFEWPLPGLLPAVAALVALRRATRWDHVLLGLMGTILVGYALYWFDGFFAGPRFMFTAVPAFVILAARAPGLAAEHLGGVMRRAAFLVLPLCLAFAWLTPTGVSSVQLRAYFYHVGRTKLKTDVAAAVRHAGLRHALVFVHEGWRARLNARLRALGLSPGDAERVLLSSDACQVQEALDAEEAVAESDTTGRGARLWAATRPETALRSVQGLSADQSFLFAEGRVITPECAREVEADSVGVAPFAPFLELEGLDPDGALGGPVVFARDFGAHNAVLRERFPDRIWYRYRPPRSLDDTAAFLPY